MRYSIYSLALLATIAMACSATAQSTISKNQFELTAGGGLWAPLLPEYEAGTRTGGGHAYRDNLDDVGGIVQLKAVRRFLGTRTNFEAKGFYAEADSFFRTDAASINVPEPVNGTSILASGGEPRLRSEVEHYGGDIGLRDTWQTRFGGLSAGAMFSYMAFDQDFDVDYTTTDLFRENLDSEFRGGKAVFGWDGLWRCRPTNLDLGIGFYDMNADYVAVGQLLPGQRATTLQETATTVETSITTRTRIRDIEVGLTLGAMYISDMPRIVHNVGGPATLVSDEAVTITAMIEILLL